MVETYKEYYLYRLYGLTYGAMAAMYDDQNGQCAICERGLKCPTFIKSLVLYPREEGRNCSIDHDHEDDTGKVRALLCHQCNTLLGFAGDNLRVLARAIVYLEQHGKTW